MNTQEMLHVLVTCAQRLRDVIADPQVIATVDEAIALANQTTMITANELCEQIDAEIEAEIDNETMQPILNIEQDSKSGWLTYSIFTGTLTPQQYMQIVCDLVRNYAVRFGTPEETLWQYIDQERATPEIAERWLGQDGSLTRTARSKFPRS